MNVLVDWLSFTLKWKGDPVGMGDMHHRLASGVLYGFLGKGAYNALYPSGYQRVKGRFPFLYALHSEETNAYLMYHPDLQYMLCELSGKGCHALHQEGFLGESLSRAYPATSRLDLSGDIACDVRPVDFAERRNGGQIRTVGTFVSGSGESAYVGSSSSDRRACVYRFYDPHPRSGFLRVEHRCKNERAKQIGELIINEGAVRAITYLGEVFGWEHDVWKTGVVAPTHIPGVPSQRGDGDRMRWVKTQVIPALKRMEQEGTIPDLRAFLEEHLFPDHSP